MPDGRLRLWKVNLSVSSLVVSLLRLTHLAGPFGGPIKKTILFVSNLNNAITPLRNGQKWSALYPGSSFLEINEVGHTSLGTGNRCVLSTISKHIDMGTLLPKTNSSGYNSHWGHLGEVDGLWNLIIRVFDVEGE